MSVSVNKDCNKGDLKCEFASLKYEQLLHDKFFVETCFSKKFDSYSAKNKLIDLIYKIK
jgi:hypothetical protein